MGTRSPGERRCAVQTAQVHVSYPLVNTFKCSRPYSVPPEFACRWTEAIWARTQPCLPVQSQLKDERSAHCRTSCQWLQ